MEWITIIGMLLFGLALIILEVIFVPGTTLVGVIGFLICGGGIYLGYEYFGNPTGTYILVIAFIVGTAVIFWSFRSNAWLHFALKDESKGRFNDDFKQQLNIGDTGTTVSSLKPVGKALFHEHELEVKSNGGFITENQSVKITKIEGNKITVEIIS